MVYTGATQERYSMAEQTKGGGYRERIYFDEELWHDIELTASHMRLKPGELVKLLTAMGLTQMKGLTMMAAFQDKVVPVIQAEMEADFERMTGIAADTPINASGGSYGSTPTRGTGLSAPSRNTGLSAPSRSGGTERRELAPVDDRLSYMRGL